jgi:voltage-gated potassium channel
MSLTVIGEARSADGAAGDRPDAGLVVLPSRRPGPLAAVLKRMLLALGLLAVSSLIVYLGRGGYHDNAHPGRPLSALASVYYATITLSTTGYGDIVPVSQAARLVNTVLITPIRVIFLIVLVGTTLEVLTERTRMNWRIARWRSKVTGQTVVVGYGSTGRSVIATLRESGQPAGCVVVVDLAPEVVAEANAAGLAAVTGDGTRRGVLAKAEAGRAATIVIAVRRDDTAVLIALTARQLNPSATIVAAVTEQENEPLLRQSGVDHVVVSSDAAGRMLGMSTVRPSSARVISDLLSRARGLDLTERPVSASEVGGPVGAAAGAVIAVLRDDQVLAADDPALRRLRERDVLILVSSYARAGAGAAIA